MGVDVLLQRLRGLLRGRDVLAAEGGDGAVHHPQFLLGLDAGAAGPRRLPVVAVVLVMHHQHLRQRQHHHHQEEGEHQQLRPVAAAVLGQPLLRPPHLLPLPPAAPGGGGGRRQRRRRRGGGRRRGGRRGRGGGEEVCGCGRVSLESVEDHLEVVVRLVLVAVVVVVLGFGGEGVVVAMSLRGPVVTVRLLLALALDRFGLAGGPRRSRGGGGCGRLADAQQGRVPQCPIRRRRCCRRV